MVEHYVPSELVFNFDQTGMKAIPTSNWTMVVERSKLVDIVGLEDKTGNNSAVGKYIGWIFYCLQVKHVCHSKFSLSDEWDIHHTDNHWNEASMVYYVEMVLLPFVEKTKNWELSSGQKAFEIFHAHQSESVLNALKKADIVHVIVTAGCTGELQPMDCMKARFTEWYADNIVESLNQVPKPENAEFSANLESKVDLRLSVMKPLHARWIFSVFDKLKVIQSGWKIAGLTNAIASVHILFH